MGATLEQFELSSKRTTGCRAAATRRWSSNRPDVIEGVHSSMIDAGAEVLETDTFQAVRLKAASGAWRITRMRSTSRPRR